jgi:hypothetical protein
MGGRSGISAIFALIIGHACQVMEKNRTVITQLNLTVDARE